MKKSLLALAVLGAFAGVASAQSSVTLSGTVDMAARYVKNDGQVRRVSLANSGLNSSQLVFKGTEDLGSGLYAGFNLNSAVVGDTGNAGLGGKFWNRRSTVSLWGGFGEVRLGRDYTPSYWNNTIFDAFGDVGIAGTSRVQQLTTGTYTRADNAIGYFLPSNIGGIYGQFMAAASENASANPGRYVGGRIGFAAGPFDIAGAYAQQRLDAILNTPQQKTFNIGGSYDFGVVKLMGFFDRDTLAYNGVFDRKENRASIGVKVPLGQGEIHAGYSRSRLTNAIANTTNSVNLFGLGYVYNLSKRTAVYTTVSRLSNGTGSAFQVDGGGGASTGPAPILGGKSSGAEFGLRHFF